MWSELNEIFLLLGSIFGGVILVMVVVSRLEDNLEHALAGRPKRPGGVAAFRHWWSTTMGSRRTGE
jgi:hypothetical protein